MKLSPSVEKLSLASEVSCSADSGTANGEFTVIFSDRTKRGTLENPQ